MFLFVTRHSTTSRFAQNSQGSGFSTDYAHFHARPTTPTSILSATLDHQVPIRKKTMHIEKFKGKLRPEPRRR